MVCTTRIYGFWLAVALVATANIGYAQTDGPPMHEWLVRQMPQAAVPEIALCHAEKNKLNERMKGGPAIPYGYGPMPALADEGISMTMVRFWKTHYETDSDQTTHITTVSVPVQTVQSGNEPFLLVRHNEYDLYPKEALYAAPQLGSPNAQTGNIATGYMICPQGEDLADEELCRAAYPVSLTEALGMLDVGVRKRAPKVADVQKEVLPKDGVLAWVDRVQVAGTASSTEVLAVTDTKYWMISDMYMPLRSDVAKARVAFMTLHGDVKDGRVDVTLVPVTGCFLEEGNVPVLVPASTEK